jgi:POT family proton-dependent oligopeptide transporter
MMKYFEQPKRLWVLIFANLCDGFSYYGCMTILVLYAMHIFQMTRDDSYLLFGVYAALIYSTPLIGGIIADKWLGNKKIMIFSGALAIIGNLILLSHSRYGFSLGLATSVVGAGFYKSNSTHLIGALYAENDPRKEMGFTFLYVFGNLGAAFAPLVFGFLVYKAGWSDGFLFSAFILFLSLIWVVFTKDIVLEAPPPLSHSPLKVAGIYLLIILSCLLLSIPFYKASIINPVMAIFFAGIIGYLFYVLKQYQGIERKRLAALFTMGFFGMFYFATTMQVETTVTLFIQQEINTGKINTHFPASVFSTLYCVFVVVLAPLSVWLWNSFKVKNIKISSPVRFAIGISLAALGILGFAFSSLTSLVLLGIVTGFFLLSAGDLIITPAVYTTLSNNGPVGFKTSIMGLWFLVVALGGYLSSILSMTSHAFSEKFFAQTNAYTGIFIFISAFTILISLGLIAIVPRLNKILV